MIRNPLLVGATALLLVTAGFATYYRIDRNHWQAKWKALDRETATVVVALRAASNNPKLEWNGVPAQIVALGNSVRILRLAIDDQNQRLDDMAAEAARLRARADELRQIAEKAQAQRRAAYAKLDDMAATPGERADCEALLAEAERALNIVREADR